MWSARPERGPASEAWRFDPPREVLSSVKPALVHQTWGLCYCMIWSTPTHQAHVGMFSVFIPEGWTWPPLYMRAPLGFWAHRLNSSDHNHLHSINGALAKDKSAATLGFGLLSIHIMWHSVEYLAQDMLTVPWGWWLSCLFIALCSSNSDGHTCPCAFGLCIEGLVRMAEDNSPTSQGLFALRDEKSLNGIPGGRAEFLF